MKRFFNTPLARIIFGSEVLALIFMLVSNFFPISLPVRISIAVFIASPYIFGIPIAETYFRAKEGSLAWFLREVFGSWWMMLGLGVIIGGIAFSQHVNLILSLLIGIGSGIGAPLHGSMSGSFFSRMIKRGLL